MNTNDQQLNPPTTAANEGSNNSAKVESESTASRDTAQQDDLNTEAYGGAEKEETFDLVVDGVDYFVRVQPFQFNDEPRYKISVNDGPQHIFVWDEQVMQIRSLDDDAAILPGTLETAISQKLISAK